MSVSTEGGTPNAVIQNPIRSIINSTASNQSQAILDRYDIEGRPIGEVDSDEEDSRPFKENSLKTLKYDSKYVIFVRFFELYKSVTNAKRGLESLAIWRVITRPKFI